MAPPTAHAPVAIPLPRVRTPRTTLNLITFAALALAGFRTLVGEGVGRADAYEAVRRAHMATLATPVRWMVRGFLAVSRDPVAVASRPGYLQFMQASFGKSIGFDQRTSADRADLVVTHCGFHRFFVEHGEPLLVGCAGSRMGCQSVG